MKINVTNILGILITLSTVAMVFLDMHYSNNPEYHFKLEGWHTLTGLILGIGLWVMPQKTVAKMIEKYVNKKINK